MCNRGVGEQGGGVHSEGSKDSVSVMVTSLALLVALFFFSYPEGCGRAVPISQPPSL